MKLFQKIVRAFVERLAPIFHPCDFCKERNFAPFYHEKVGYLCPDCSGALTNFERSIHEANRIIEEEEQSE